jgi:2-desacetyl-2-hydroxyethyl bacteriochlorophyllide A dehydrogenase
MNPETSIIIRTFNEQKRLPALFDALARQTYRDFEIIVVDSGSFDRTRDIAAARADRVIRISPHDFTFGYSLNTGIRAARGGLCVVVSAHTLPIGEDWLARLTDPLRSDDVAMCYGRQLGMSCSKFGEVEDFERLYGAEPRIEHPSRLAANNANAAIRRDLWSQHPFDEKLTGLEDIAWARTWMSRGLKVVYEPRAAIHHVHEESWRQIRQRYFREAVAWRRMGLKGRRSVPGELAREVGRGLGDIVRAFAPDGNPVAERLSLGRRLREIVYYRFHKTSGTLMGLALAHPLETRREQEDVLFNRGNRAVVIRAPRQADIEDMELPELKPGDALIRVAHTGVCGTDIEILEGRLGYFANGLSAYPIVPGHEFSGRVVATGVKADGFAEGDPVVVECIQGCGTCRECLSGNAIGCAERSEVGVMRRHGAYAEYVVSPARFLHHVPEGLDLRRAALTEPLAVALKGFRRVGFTLGGGRRACAVLGAGPLGHLCALALAERGHDVTAFDRNPERLKALAGSGIAVSETLAGLDAYPVIVEVTGNPEVLDQALRQSPANATLLLLGLPYGRREFSFETIAAYDKTVVGSVGSAAEDFAAALALLPKLRTDPLLACAVPLAEYSRAWEISRSGKALKVILDVEECPPSRAAPSP